MATMYILPCSTLMGVYCRIIPPPDVLRFAFLKSKSPRQDGAVRTCTHTHMHTHMHIHVGPCPTASTLLPCTSAPPQAHERTPCSVVTYAARRTPHTQRATPHAPLQTTPSPQQGQGVLWCGVVPAGVVPAITSYLAGWSQWCPAAGPPHPQA